MLKAYKMTERSIFYKVGAPARIKQALVKGGIGDAVYYLPNF